MKKFVEKFPVIKFPKDQILGLSIATPILVEKELEKMKLRTKDLFFGLFSKDDMSIEDGRFV